MVLTVVGIGKSSLIEAFLDMSPDIVHYDPPHPVGSASPSASFVKPFMSRPTTLLETHGVLPSTDNIMEIRASTCAYPSWWKTESEREKARPVLARRESVGEVLERNICFVDTPGYGSCDDVCS
jgi:hypothetical protein